MYRRTNVLLEEYVMTKRQREFIEFISAFININGYPPSVREIADGMRISSTSSVKKMLDRLEKTGAIRRNSNKARGIEMILDFGIPLVGRIKAGVPVLSEENMEGFISMKKVVKYYPDSFFLKVEGDSMRGKGIFEGDYLLIKPGKSMQSGEVGVFLINEEFTVKTFKKNFHSGVIYLKPENPDYQCIKVNENDELEVIGKVVMVLRSVEDNLWLSA